MKRIFTIALFSADTLLAITSKVYRPSSIFLIMVILPEFLFISIDFSNVSGIKNINCDKHYEEGYN